MQGGIITGGRRLLQSAEEHSDQASYRCPVKLISPSLLLKRHAFKGCVCLSALEASAILREHGVFLTEAIKFLDALFTEQHLGR